MAGAKNKEFSPERLLFMVLLLLLVFFGWRTYRIKPLPSLPGTPQQKGIGYVEGFKSPAESAAAAGNFNYAAQGVRSPFEKANDNLRVMAAVLISQINILPAGGSAEVVVDYRIMPYPANSFQILLPANVKLLRVDGAGVLKRDGLEPEQTGEGNLYTVRLATPVDNKYLLRLHLEWPKVEGREFLQVPVIKLPDATHHRGIIVLSAAQPLRVQAENLQPAQVDGLPGEMKNKFTFAAYRYTSLPYQMFVDLTPPPKPPDPPKPPANQPPENPKVETKPVDPEKPWQLPVTYKGTIMTGDRRSVLLQSGDEILRKFEGDEVLGLTIIEINASSVILENKKGQRFKLRDTSRDKNEF